MTIITDLYSLRRVEVMMKTKIRISIRNFVDDQVFTRMDMSFRPAFRFIFLRDSVNDWTTKR